MRDRTQQPSLPKIKGHWVLGLPFGLLFVGIGCYPASICVRMVIGYYGARSWVETSAVIDEVQLQGTETHLVRCSYAYTFDGRQYRGERVGLSGVWDTDPWQQATYDRLRRAHDRRQPVPCYVDPGRPDHALLDRQFRPYMMIMFSAIGLVFGFPGGLLVAKGAIELVAHRRMKQRARQYPNEPWLWNPKWATGVIRSTSGSKAIAMWAGAILWNAVVLVGLLATWSKPSCILALFFVIGAGVIWKASRLTVNARRLRGARLELETMPGVIGGHLKGNLIIDRDPHELGEITVTLRCAECSEVATVGEKEKLRTIWADIQRIRPPSVTAGRTVTVLPMEFEIPYSREMYNEPGAHREIEWELEARASGAGSGTDLTFQVPVFVTEASIIPPTELHEKHSENEDLPFPDHVRCEQGSSGHYRLEAAARPRPYLIGTILIIAVLLAASCVFSIVQNIRGKEYTALTLLSFAGTVPLLWMALRLAACSTVRFKPGTLNISRYWGLFHVTRDLAIRDIVNVTCDRSNDSGIGDDYVINAHTADGQAVQLAHVISGRMPAQWFYNQFVRLAAMHDVEPSQQSQEEQPQGA